MSLNLSRVSAPRKGPPFPHSYEDRNKVPGAPNPGPFGPFLHLAQQSHSSHRPTRSHMIWLLPYWPALLAPGFTSGSHEGHPSILMSSLDPHQLCEELSFVCKVTLRCDVSPHTLQRV